MFKEVQRRVTAGLVASALIITNVLLPVAPAFAWTTNPNQDPKTNHKSYICKMVGTPGQDERLQTGNNPIQVDRKDNHTIGAMFVDAQQGSFVVGYGFPSEAQSEGPQLSDCIKMVTPTPAINLNACTPGTTGTDTVSVTVTNNDQVTGNIAVYTVTVGGQIQTSNALADNQSQTLTFSGLGQGSHSVTIDAYGQRVYTGNVTVGSCQESTPRIATPALTIEGVCGVDNDVIIIPTSDDYTTSAPVWNNGIAEVTFTIKDTVDKVFAETGTKTVTVSIDEENTAACPLEQATAEISIEDATCELGQKLVYGPTVNASFSNISTPNGSYGFASYTVIAVANQGAVFADDQPALIWNGTLSGKLQQQSTDANAACYKAPIIPETPATPSVAPAASQPKPTIETLPNTSGSSAPIIVGGAGIVAIITLTVAHAIRARSLGQL